MELCLSLFVQPLINKASGCQTLHVLRMKYKGHMRLYDNILFSVLSAITGNSAVCEIDGGWAHA